MRTKQILRRGVYPERSRRLLRMRCRTEKDFSRPFEMTGAGVEAQLRCAAALRLVCSVPDYPLVSINPLFLRLQLWKHATQQPRLPCLETIKKSRLRR